LLNGTLMVFLLSTGHSRKPCQKRFGVNIEAS
jgi:hypothetical protein